jgi:serine/threonine protein kinase
MKILKKETIEKRNQKIHTKAERRILENMNCSFIVQLNFAFQTEEKLYLVMEFMRGGKIFNKNLSIKKMVGELFYHLRKSKKFNEEKTKFYAAEIILALEYLHKRDVIYR